jgi:hypothetical protein
MSAEAETKTGKEEAFLCPFCGAPYRELIPADTVQVKCHYCGATIFVPPPLGGAVKRCPNHPEALAVGLCSKCGESYCEHCLHVAQGESSVKIYYCPECLKEVIERNEGAGVLCILILLVSGLPMLGLNVGIGLLYLILVSSLSYAIIVYKPHYPTLYEKRTELERIADLYSKLLEKYRGDKEALDNKINSQIGLRSRESVIYKLAEEEGLTEKEPVDLYKKLLKVYKGEEQTLEDRIRWRMITGESREEAIYNIARQRGLVE